MIEPIVNIEKKGTQLVRAAMANTGSENPALVYPEVIRLVSIMKCDKPPGLLTDEEFNEKVWTSLNDDYEIYFMHTDIQRLIKEAKAEDKRNGKK
jgi:hypothetical protein